MLGTHERTLLLDCLRPPAGYRLRRAVGTSFTLDLMALLTAPLAFTYFDAHDDEGVPVGNPVALLEALRRHAEKITLFCQAGAIGVPAPDQKLLVFLEGSVVEVHPRTGGIFHPKVWVLNFTAKEKPAIYRILCLSRNLTFARSWDTCLRLDGELREDGVGDPRNEPFAEFLLALPGISIRPVANGLREEIKRMADEVRRVKFTLPPPFADFRVHNFGLGNGRVWPFPKAGRSLVVSPFLVGSTVGELVRKHGLDTLVSRPEAFDEVWAESKGREALPKRCHVLAPGASLDSRDADGDDNGASDERPQVGDDIELAGLHAKLFLFEEGSKARLFTGSANATAAAFNKNVEVLVELIGKQSKCGIDALLGSGADPQHATLRSLLQEYRPPDNPEPDEVRQIRKGLERKLDRLSRAVGALPFTATVRDAAAEQRWDLTLSGTFPEIIAGAKLRVWPATLPRDATQVIAGTDAKRHESAGASGPAGEIATFGEVSFEALTAFFAFEASLRKEQHVVRKRFAVTAELVGAPADRISCVVRRILKDKRRVLQLIFLILQGEGADVSRFTKAVRGHSHNGRPSPGSLGGWNGGTLLEALLRSLSADPRRIDDAARLISDLRKTAEGRELLPDGLEEIWKPVWAARKAMES